jgi:hypothetical protein
MCVDDFTPLWPAGTSTWPVLQAQQVVALDQDEPGSNQQ